MIGEWTLFRNGFARTAINRCASVQSPLKRTLRTESPSGGFVGIARGFIPVRG